MADSLVIGNTIELLGGGVTSALPVCAGARFRLVPGWDLSAPQPTSDFVASLILDGSRPYGRRADNRQIRLPVVIQAPDRLTLAAAREVLEQAVDQDRWTLTWTRDPGGGPALPLLIDCFRAQATTPGYDLGQERHLISAVGLTIPALPYGRSDVQTRVAFATPVPSAPPPPPPPVVLDTFSSINSPVHYQSQRCVVGPQSLCWDPDDDRVRDPGGQTTTFTYAAQLGVTQNLTGLTGLQMFLGFGTRYYHCLEYHGHIHGVAVTVTLTDSSGVSVSASRTGLRLPVSPSWGAPAFSRVTMPIPQGVPGFNYQAVVSYSVTMANRFAPRSLRWVTAYVDNLAAYPPSVQVTPTVRGSVYTLHGVQGTARAPVSMTFIQPPTAGAPTVVSAAGVGNYTVPAGTAWAKVEGIGSGGPGAAAGWGPVTAAGGGTAGGYYTVVTAVTGAVMAPGDLFKFTAGPNAAATVYAVTAVSAPFAGYCNVTFAPNSPAAPSAADTLTLQAAVRGGGSGAEYAREDVFPCKPGDLIPYSVPAGAAPGANGQPAVFGPGPGGPLVLIANGGLAAAANSTAGPAGGTGSQNSVRFPGGAGRTASGSVGGGGGSSAGYAAPGLTPTGTAAVLYQAPGTWPWICPAGVYQVFAESWGSGASGGTGSNWSDGSGGGAGEYAAGYVPVTPGTSYNVVVAAGGTSVTGSAQDGRDGASSSFTGDAGTVITGHGGQRGSGQNDWGGGGPGGTGSTAPVHYRGGQGGPSNPYAGSGGSSAGPSSPGNTGSGYGGTTPAPSGGGQGGAGSGATNNNGGPGQVPGGGGGGTYGSVTSGAGAGGQVKLTYPGGAPTNNGAAAVPGGGAGGHGGGTPGSAGQAGSGPGGAGGGANSSGPAQPGGTSGPGWLKVTPYTSAPVRCILAHRPPFGAPKTFQPLVPVGGGADVPDGTRQYPVPLAPGGVGADFGGTYTIYGAAASWAGGAGSSTPRTVFATVTQYEYPGGPSYPVPTTPVIIAPSQVVNGLVTLGVLTLPQRPVAPDNTTSYYTCSITDSQTGDRWNDLVFCDTMGQTLVVNNNAAGYITYWADAPNPDVDLGYLLGSQTDRSSAISVIDGNTVLSGGPLHVEPAEGDNQLFCYSTDGLTPNVALSYFAAYFFDRTQ